MALLCNKLDENILEGNTRQLVFPQEVKTKEFANLCGGYKTKFKQGFMYYEFYLITINCFCTKAITHLMSIL